MATQATSTGEATIPAPHQEIDRCEECVELLVDYLDNSLSPAERAALEQHLSCCMPCITFVRTYKATSHLCRKKLEADMPEELRSSLRQFLRRRIPALAGVEGGAAKDKTPH